jgi:protein-arginine deiminase
MRRSGYGMAILAGLVAAFGWGCGGDGGGGSSPGDDTVAADTAADAPAEEDLAGEDDSGTPLPTDCDPGVTGPCDDGDPCTEAACDGAGTCAVVTVLCVDLRGDVNRNGTVDLDDPTEDAGEDDWTAEAGAIFLANIDDDQEACPVSGSDEALAACNDAKDEIINGHEDLEDLARLATVPWPGAPDDAVATLTVSIPAAPYVRVFRKAGDDWVFHATSTQLTAADIRAGVEFAIEGTDFVRDDTVWDGTADMIWSVSGTGFPETFDVVRYRLSPILLYYQTQPATRLYVTKFSSSDSIAFRDDLKAAMGAIGMHEPLYEIEGYGDQWTQDFFETGWMAMPAVGGQHVIHMNLRSANYTGGQLRNAGRVVYTQFRGKDVAGGTVYDPNHDNNMDSLNSFGNTETVPPYEFDGVSYPNGRVFRGSVPTFYTDPAFDRMLDSQKVQPMLTIDTSWLLVAHVDETIAFITHKDNPRGWTVAINNAAQAWEKFQELQDAGLGDTPLFVGKNWDPGDPADTTVSEVLADPDLAQDNQWAVTEVEGQLETLKAEIGITDAELVQVPFLHWDMYGYSVAYQPGFVNGIHLDGENYAPPKGHGPMVDGGYVFQEWVTENFAAAGLTLHFLEDWDLYHRLLGEVHCASNATRVIPDQTWWGSGL